MEGGDCTIEDLFFLTSPKLTSLKKDHKSLYNFVKKAHGMKTGLAKPEEVRKYDKIYDQSYFYFFKKVRLSSEKKRGSKCRIRTFNPYHEKIPVREYSILANLKVDNCTDGLQFEGNLTESPDLCFADLNAMRPYNLEFKNKGSYLDLKMNNYTFSHDKSKIFNSMGEGMHNVTFKYGAHSYYISPYFTNSKPKLLQLLTTIY